VSLLKRVRCGAVLRTPDTAHSRMHLFDHASPNSRMTWGSFDAVPKKPVGILKACLRAGARVKIVHVRKCGMPACIRLKDVAQHSR
jgi:hypothetical protein